MPRWLKVVIWIGVFSLCAAAGAYVAAHTDPFPPGVDDPGARSAPEPSDAPSTEVERWRVSVRGSATHAFRVGGECVSSWTGSAQIPVEGGALPPEGARVVLRGEGSCDFPVAQIQARELELELVPTDPGSDVVTTRVVARTPTGAEDLGGLATAIAQEPFEIASGSRDAVRAQVSDGRGGTITSAVTIDVRCVRGCR